jgi:PBP1b-binding outer membrane lipoprotein LpoB
MKIISILLISSLFLSGCASREIKNNPDTIVDDILVLGTLGLYRGSF